MGEKLEISKKLCEHSVVICSRAHDRSHLLKTFFERQNCRVIETRSMFECLSVIEREVPHFVVMESLLDDGHAGHLYDRLQKDLILCKTPIFVLILRKNKQEVEPIVGRKFASVVVGKLTEEKLAAIMSSVPNVSPHFLGCSEVGIESKISMQIQADVIGLHEGNIVIRSGSTLNIDNRLTASRSDGATQELQTPPAISLRGAKDYFNFFPIHRLRGSKRGWILKIPEVETKPLRRSLLIVDSNDQRAEELARIVKAFGFEVGRVRGFDDRTTLKEINFLEFRCVYFAGNEEVNAQWVNLFGKVRRSKRPQIILASSVEMRVFPDAILIEPPFGIGTLIEAVTVCSQGVGDIEKQAEKMSSTPSNTLNFELDCRLLGIDESGGVLVSDCLVVPGTHIKIDHGGQNPLWDVGTEALVMNTERVSDGLVPSWQIRFEAVAKGTSKVKYWSKVIEVVHAAA